MAQKEKIEKPFYPVAPFQYFKNQSYRSMHFASRKNSLGDWKLKSTKHLFLGGNAGSVVLRDSPGGNSVSFPMAACGYPIDPTIHNKIFEGMIPVGHLDINIDAALLDLLFNCPLISFEVTKTMQSVWGAIRQIPKGKYVSVGRNFRNRRSENQSRSVFDVNTNNSLEFINTESFNIFCMDPDTMAKQFDTSNLFVSTDFAQFKNLGLMNLPHNSVVWYWDEASWITCSVEFESHDKGEDVVRKMKFNKIEISSSGSTSIKGVALELSGTELDLHKTVAKLLEDDTIRIAQKSIKNIVSAGREFFGVRAHIVKMLVADFKSPILESVKTNMLNSSEHKNMQNVLEFSRALTNKFNPIDIHPWGAIVMKKVWAQAVYAAQDKVPLYWGNQFIEMTDLRINEQISNFGIIPEQMSYRNECQALQSLGIPPEQRVETFKKIDVECCGIFTTSIKRIVKGSAKNKIEIEVPIVVLNQSKEVIENYVRLRMQDMDGLNNPDRYEQSASQDDIIERIERNSFIVDLSSIKIKP